MFWLLKGFCEVVEIFVLLQGGVVDLVNSILSTSDHGSLKEMADFSL